MSEGARDKSFVMLLIVSTVNGCEFRVHSVSATSVTRDSLSSEITCLKRWDDSIACEDLICLSQVPCGLQQVVF